MSHPVFQHLVPQWYLRRFADERGRIRRVNKDASVNEVRRVRDVGGEAHFYTLFDNEGSPDFGFEHELSKVESIAAEAVSGLVETGLPLATKRRSALALFMAVQLDRGRLARDWLDWFYDTTVTQLEKQPIASGAPAMPRDLWRDAGLEVTEDRVVLPKSQKIEMLVMRAEMVAAEMYRRSWQLVRLPTAGLFTGDQPVSFFNHDRSAATNAFDALEIRWPLDRSTALILGPSSLGTEDSVRHGTFTDVESINHSTADWSYEWIFDHPQGPTNTMVARWLTSTEAQRNARREAQSQRRWPSDDTLKVDESTRRSAIKRDFGLTDSNIDDYRKRLGGKTPPRGAVGRNERCWCGSGKKHKYCHGR